MTERVSRHKLSREILVLIALSGMVSVILFLILSYVATGVAETFCFEKQISMTEFDWMAVDRWIFGVSASLSCVCFSVLFLALMGDRIAYIRTITAGIAALHGAKERICIPLEGNNELTELALAINEMSEAERLLRKKEQALAEEKEALIRTLSHDIRTPLTSILAYSDYLSGKESLTAEEQKSYMELIRRKAEQIRELTDILLDGSRRKLEQFDDGRLLVEQIVEEFCEELEDTCSLAVDLSDCHAFSAQFDVQELRRIFDNLASNIRKYADPTKPVALSVRVEDDTLLISQTNAVLPRKLETESYQIGLNSIRRIAQLYGGSVTVEQKTGQFSIFIRLANL